jgi:site-specific DNA recombinase
VNAPRLHEERQHLMTDQQALHAVPWAQPIPGRPWAPPDLPDPARIPVTVPVAWLGRTSTEDSQDPTLSLPRQLANARKALPPGWVIVAHFYDVESGRKDLADRGNSQAFARFQIPIPRDGSITDLLAEAKRPDRRFAAVICESIERVARRTYVGTRIEHELEQAGVALCAADEPIVTGHRAKKATSTLTRRIKQSVAEWYVVNMLELSWDGFVTHTQQGWNTGKPPYGYRAEKVAHPVPARRAEGGTKHRLIPDPERAPAVTRIYQLRATERLGYDAIAERLNADPAANPPPQPTRPGSALGRWTGGAVREILRNPKYTGYQVWNRRSTKNGGKNVNPAEWVWSPQPTHEPLVTKELFDAVSQILGTRNGSRGGTEKNPHKLTKHTYVLRSYVFCDLCGRRMWGVNHHGVTYYACTKNKRQHVDRDWYDTHPAMIMIREERLLPHIRDLFADRVFGPDRRYHLADRLTANAGKVQRQEREEEQARLAKTVADLSARQRRLIQSLAAGDGGADEEAEREFRDAIRAEHADLGRQLKQHQARIAELAATPATALQANEALLDALPQLTAFDATRLPEPTQRRLYDAFGLELRYNRLREDLALQVVVRSGIINEQRAVALEVAGEAGARPLNTPSGHNKTGADTKVSTPAVGNRARHGEPWMDARSAPGRIRTYAPASGGRCSIP